MFAYSTLAQIGFILVGIGWGTPLSLAAALIFTINHALIKSTMLMLSGYLASRAPVKSASFSMIKGTGKYAPLAGVLFFLGGMALAGLPPMNGFISKLSLFQSGVSASQAGPFSETLFWVPLLLLGVSSIITMVYVFRAMMKIWWEPFKPASPEEKVKPHGDRLIAPAGLIALCLILGIWAEPLLKLAQDTTAWITAPEKYVQAVLKESQATNSDQWSVTRVCFKTRTLPIWAGQASLTNNGRRFASTFRRELNARRVDDHLWMIGSVLMAFCGSRGQAHRGQRCRKNMAAHPPVGDACETGRNKMCF